MDALHAAGSKVRTRGNHVQAQCPAHSDRTPSLSIDYKAGKTVVHCQSGCAIDDVLVALGLGLGDLFDEPLPDKQDRPRATQSRPRTPARKRSLGPLPKRLTSTTDPEPVTAENVTAEYIYYAETGEPIAKAMRIEWSERDTAGITSTAKKFSQRYWQAGEWVHRKPADLTHVPLWHWPQVHAALSAGTAEVWLTEGEKDADRLDELLTGDEHAIATTNIAGAANLTAAQCDTLSGAAVVHVVVDHDRAGYARGLTAIDQLTGRVGRVRVWLPAITSSHADLSDHLDAGHTLDQLVETSRDRLLAMRCRAEAEQAADSNLVDEVTGHLELAAAAEAKKATKKAADHRRWAVRWAHQAGQLLIKINALLAEAEDTRQVDQLKIIRDTLDRAVQVAHDAYRLADVDPFDDVAAVLTAHDTTTTEAGGEADDNVVELPSARRGVPATRIPTSRGHWRYDLGDKTARGVYVDDRSHWLLVAPLPHVHARQPRRDGRGKRTATDYIVSATADGPRVVVDHDAIRTGEWANQLGMVLSDDSKIIAAVGTAIRTVADEAPEVEAVTVVDADTGALTLPMELPSGYFECSPAAPDDALAAWRQILDLSTPRIALALGASAIAPYLHAAVGPQRSHIVSLTAAPNQGKTIILKTLAGVWGNPLSQSVMCDAWNTSPLGVTRDLGQVRILPAYRDEAAMTQWQPAQWGRFIYSLTQGVSRTTPDRTGGTRSTAAWWSIFFSTGNAEMTEGLDHGAFAGCRRRVVELAISTPSAEVADQILRDADDTSNLPAAGLLTTAYGHLGAAIRQSVTAHDARQLVIAARDLLPASQLSGDARQIAPLLHTHLAGAMIIDQVLGTGDQLTLAALDAAHEHLATWEPPESEGSRMLDAVVESLSSEPGRWPTRDEYAEWVKPHPVADPSHGAVRVDLPQHGFDRSNVLGVRLDDDHDTVWVIQSRLDELVDPEINRRIACTDLIARGVLIPPARGKGHAQTQRVVGGRPSVKVYVFRLHDTLTTPTTDDPNPETGPTGPETAPVTTSVTTCYDPATTTVTTPKLPLTRDVTTVTTLRENSSRTREASQPPPPASKASDYTAASTADWGAAEFDAAVADRIDADDQEALDTLAQLMDAREARYRAASAQPAPKAAAPAQKRRTAPQRPAIGTPATTYGLGRFTAPAAVLGATEAHRGGTNPVVDWTPGHLGDLARFAHDLRLGWGGGETYPDAPQLWLTGDALDRLDLPSTIDLPDTDEVRSFSEEREAFLAALEPVQQHPVVADALAQGWQLAQGRLDGWTRLYHPDHDDAWARTGVRLVFLPWIKIKTPLTDTTDPAVLADRLHQFACATGVSWRVHSAITVLDLIDHTRPPRRDGEPAGTRRQPTMKRVRHGQPAELPDFLTDPRDGRFRALEADFSWWRPWGSLLDDEKRRSHVVVYDRSKSYLTAWGNVDLGVDGLTHHTGTAAAWDGREKPGLHLIDRPDPKAWPWRLPNPLGRGGGHVEDGRVWVTTHTLRQLAMHGITPTVHEAYRWTTTSRYLAPATDRLRDAIKNQDQLDPNVYRAIKELYTRGGVFAKIDHDENAHLWRPDWWFHIIGASRTGILTTLDDIHHRTGAVPLFVDRDAIAFATDDPNPDTAWPGNPDKYRGARLGNWHPVGTAPLADWGPTHLTDNTLGRAFRYQAAVTEAITPVDDTEGGDH